MQQGQGNREGVGWTECGVLPETHLWWQPCEQGHYHGAGSNCRNATSQGISSVRIFWHVPNAISILYNLSDSDTSVSMNDFLNTCATVSSVWEVDGLSGWGSSSKDRHTFLKWEYHSHVFDRLRQDSTKAACSISYVSAPVFPRQKQKLMHTGCWTFSSIVEVWRTLQVDVHLEASTERMRGDTGFRLCKYTCTELPPDLPCCQFAAYYRFPGKKICLGIK
jgi:hypothetical protein